MRRSVLIQAWLKLTLSLAVLALFQTAAHAQTRELDTRGELLDRVAAIVNDGVVLSSELDEQVSIVGQRIREQKLDLPPQNVLRQQVLDRLVLQEIQMQRADKAGLKVSDDNLNAALQDVAQRNKLTLAQLPEALASQGIDYTAYRDDIRKELTLSLLKQRDVLQRIAITPREVDQFLEKQSKMPSEKSEYNVSHILIAVPQEASPQLVEQAQKKAQEVYEKAKNGEDFAQLALAYSNDQKALEGGALGWLKGGELPTFLTDVVVHLKEGQVSEPLRTPSGFHVAKLNGVRSNEGPSMEDQVHVRHILMKTTELADDATVRQKLSALRDRVLKGEDFAGLAQTTSEDPGSANQGGDLGWTGPGTFAPEFEAQIEKLKDKEISEPFKSQFGWHIAQMMGRRNIDVSTDLKRRQAIEAIRASRADEETELWLRRLRDEAYVDYKL